MKLSIAGLLLLGCTLLGCSGGSGQDANLTINGAGATFPYPIYAQWAHQYASGSGVRINYNSMGSGAGIQQIKSHTVDFGASDAPLDIGELKADGLVQFPLVIGGIVPVVHLEGVAAGQLKLTGKLLADLFLGNVLSWDDAEIQRINPDLKLPKREVAVVHRADGSGTTWIFSSYLAEAAPEWKEKVGVGKSLSWPVGVGGKGNEGVAAYVNRIDGSIGYVEYAYALQNKMAQAQLQNRAGKFVQPNIETFQAAAANADWQKAAGYNLVLVDQPGDTSWPITGASFILLHADQENAERGRAMLKFFTWCYEHGAKSAEALDYVPIPKNVVQLVKATWADQVTSGGKPLTF